MDKYLFRGKPDIDQEWLDDMEMTLGDYLRYLDNAECADGFVYGQVVYSRKKEKAWIVGIIADWSEDYLAHEWWVPVKVETISQYIGIKDVKGKKIFEGDVLKGAYFKRGEKKRFIGIVKYSYNGFIIDGVKQYLGYAADISGNYEIIGNIHDNPELLEVS